MADRVRYLRFLNGQWRWRPEKYMRAYGFKLTTLGPELTAAVIARAAALNEEWDRVKRGAAAAQPVTIKYPPGTVGNGYQRAMEQRAADRIEAGKPQTKEQEKRDDWPRAWKHLQRWALYDPTTLQPEHFLAVDPTTGRTVGLIADLNKISVSERHRTIKVWRTLWKKMATMGYCDLVNDPSKVRANSAPDPRQAIWTHAEVMKLVQGAWRANKRALASFIAISWDTMLCPVDVRKLTLAQLSERSLFSVVRAKTGRAAAGTLTPYSVALLEAYLGSLGFNPIDGTLWRTAGSEPGPKGGRRWAPVPYTKDKLEKDFAKVRAAVFGPGETRQLGDLRRSGHVEGDAGGGTPADASSKMANTISVSNRLRKTYNPVNVPAVRRFDEARTAGRKALKAERQKRNIDR
jgi:hypothetical protein